MSDVDPLDHPADEIARLKKVNEEQLTGWLALRDAKNADHHARYYITSCLAESMRRSLSWRITAPLRALRRWLKPGCCGQHDLLAWSQVEPVTGVPGCWRPTGPAPRLIVPCCFPAGWLRVRLAATCQLRLLADCGQGFVPLVPDGHPTATDGVNWDLLLETGKEIRGLCLEPPADSEIRITDMRIEAVPLWRIWLNRLLRHRTERQAGAGLRDINADYRRWRKQRASSRRPDEVAREIAGMARPPRISVLMPVYNSPEKYLRLAIASVRRQSYPHWELCIADDASTAPHVRKVLHASASLDPRIKVVFRPTNGGISAASNAALELATGEYFALLDHDDELADDALFQMARAIVADPALDLVYGDEDKLDARGRHVEPLFKPDWLPESFLAYMYTHHLGVLRTSLAREVGGFRGEFDGYQDYDLLLRVAARGPRVKHIAEVLYHWRMLPGSTATAYGAKPDLAPVARRTLQAHLDSLPHAARIEPGPTAGTHRVRFPIQGQPRVSIILASACRPTVVGGQEAYLAGQCIRSIRGRTSWSAWEVLLVHEPEVMPESLARELDALGVRRQAGDAPFDWARAMNRGAEAATGEHLLFLHDDIEVITPDWIERLLEYSQLPAIGAVGGRLLNADGSIQQAGVVLEEGLPASVLAGFPADHPGPDSSNGLVHNCPAVSGACLMTRAELFKELQGFREAAGRLSDIDYCLRGQESGRRVVLLPDVQLFHAGEATRPPASPAELASFQEHWEERSP